MIYGFTEFIRSPNSDESEIRLVMHTVDQGTIYLRKTVPDVTQYRFDIMKHLKADMASEVFEYVYQTHGQGD